MTTSQVENLIDRMVKKKIGILHVRHALFNNSVSSSARNNVKLPHLGFCRQRKHPIAFFLVPYICLSGASCGEVVGYFTSILGFKDDGIIATCLSGASCSEVVGYFTSILGFKDDGIIAK